jgi:hypothetical protein
MSVGDFLLLGLSNAALIAITQFLATSWLKARFESSIRQVYDKRLEDFRFQFKQREQAALIAELLAEWSSGHYDPKRLNRLIWEASLWLPAETVTELSKIVGNSPAARPMKQLLVEVRSHIKGKQDGVGATHIVHFGSAEGIRGTTGHPVGEPSGELRVHQPEV